MRLFSLLRAPRYRIIAFIGQSRSRPARFLRRRLALRWLSCWRRAAAPRPLPKQLFCARRRPPNLQKCPPVNVGGALAPCGALDPPRGALDPVGVGLRMHLDHKVASSMCSLEDIFARCWSCDFGGRFHYVYVREYWVQVYCVVLQHHALHCHSWMGHVPCRLLLRLPQGLETSGPLYQ